jgi:glycosyltransferase involved in cell wall biosynthesis
MTRPAVSVLVPCFNQGQWIDEAIDSVLEQTVQDFEIIVVDDGSTDEATRHRLETQNWPRTRAIRTANRGLPAARNAAARLATGEFLCALDADDRLASTWFEKALAAFDRDPDLAFVSHWLEAFGDEQWLWRPERCELPDLLVRNVVNSAALVRRAAFESVGGFDESMRDGCEDWDFWLRVVEAGHRGTIVPEVQYFYRRNEHSMSRRMTRSPAVYQPPLDRLFTKHADSLRAHALDVLLSKELETTTLLREVHGLDRDRIGFVLPSLRATREESAALAAAAQSNADAARRAAEIAAAREEAARLRSEVGGLRSEVDALRSDAASLADALAATRREAAASDRRVRELRESWSWRVTAPLRLLAGWLLRATR